MGNDCLSDRGYFAAAHLLCQRIYSLRQTNQSSLSNASNGPTSPQLLSGVGCVQARIDVPDRLRSGEGGFTIDELSMGIVPWLRKSFSSKNAVSLVVSCHTAQRRMDFIQEFISWHMHCAISRLPSSDSQIQGIQAKLEAMEMAFKHLKLKSRAVTVNKVGLSRSAQNRLLEVCHPDHPQNPWHGNVRIRNYLVMLLFLSFGIRRSELLNLYVSDCLTQGSAPELRVQRGPDDSLDPFRRKVIHSYSIPLTLS